MSDRVAFPAPVRDWIAHNLARGVQPDAVRQELIGRGGHADVAAAMVRAVSAALLLGAELPGEVLDVQAPPLAYVPDPMRLAPGTRLQADDRPVEVLMRLQQPAAALLAGVLSAQECAALIALAQPRLLRSTVVDPVTGRNVVAGHRSSDGMFFRLGETPLIATIERRIAALTGWPVEHGEGLQILHYETGAESTPHVDYLVRATDTNRASVARSGQRMATLILYLNDVEAGGETVFAHAGCAVTPRCGQALYFEYGNQQGLCDPASLHASLPVRAGTKWVATKWIRAQRFVPAGATQAAGAPELSTTPGMC